MFANALIICVQDNMNEYIENYRIKIMFVHNVGTFVEVYLSYYSIKGI